MRGHVRRRGNSWAVVVDVGRDADGKRKQKWSGGFRRRKDAERALSDTLSRLDGGAYVEPHKITVGDYLTGQWLPAMQTQVQQSTLESYARNVRGHVLPQLGPVPLQRLTGDQLSTLYAQLLIDGRRDGQGLAPRTVRYTHAIVRRALSDAVQSGLLTRNPADRAKPPRQAPNRDAMRTWTAAELRAFLQSRADDRLYAMWMVLASTGMRRGEVLGLGWEHVDLDAGRIAVRRALTNVAYGLVWSEPKTAKSRRSVALDPATVAALRDHRKAQLQERMAWGPAWTDHGLVFCRENGEPVHPDRVSKLFDQHLKAADLPRIRLHDLRHTHATLALSAGIHPKVVSERLGHATIAMTLDTYSHAIPAMEADAAAKVAALVLDGP